MLRTRTSMNELSSDECLDLLMTERPRVGRLAFVDADGPVVFPMNYIADGKLIYFHTAPGSTLLAALEMRQVTFEIDHVDDVPEPRTPTAPEQGWSVLAFGRLRALTDEDELAHVRQSPLRAWADDEDSSCYLRMDVSTLAGRRFL
jgi:nitroimidazol reductase NimA-like FMN-containing flavoprotein (pyridoxamine 5'-phosphate oxidase superfamily)